MSSITTPAPVVNVTHGKMARDSRNSRRTARTLSEDRIALEAAVNLLVCDDGTACVVKAGHGGSVPNNYGYAAVTDAVVAIAVRDGATVRVACFATQIPANKVTLCGVAGTVGLSDLYDRRVKSEARENAALAHAEELARGNPAYLSVELPSWLAGVLADETIDAGEASGLIFDGLRDAGVEITTEMAGMSLKSLVRYLITESL